MASAAKANSGAVRISAAPAVEDRLDHATGPGELRMVHMQQRQPGHWPDRGARPRDIEQSGCHAEIGIRLLEFPGQLAQADAAHLRAGEHRHRVGLKPLHRLGHAAQADDSRHSRDFGFGRRAGRSERPW